VRELDLVHQPVDQEDPRPWDSKTFSPTTGWARCGIEARTGVADDDQDPAVLLAGDRDGHRLRGVAPAPCTTALASASWSASSIVCSSPTAQP